VLSGGLESADALGESGGSGIDGQTVLQWIDPIELGGMLLVEADSVALSPGSAGILAGLDWAAQNVPAAEWLVSVPGDCPFLPKDLVTRLHEARVTSHVPLACARSGEWRHPVVGLWPVKLREDLRHALVGEDLHKIELWTARHGVAIAEWAAVPFDPFFNVNTPKDVAQAEAIAAKYPNA